MSRAGTLKYHSTYVTRDIFTLTISAFSSMDFEKCLFTFLDLMQLPCTNKKKGEAIVASSFDPSPYSSTHFC